VDFAAPINAENGEFPRQLVKHAPLQSTRFATQPHAGIQMLGIKALSFDVFGTVVDWRGSIRREGEKLGAAKGIDLDWNAFALAWRAGYKPAMDKVRRGEMPWTILDDLHRTRLEEILLEFGLAGRLTVAELEHLNHVWHRLTPWPDSVPGLSRLKRKFTITPLSNGHVALLNNMAKAAGLPWDLILCAEIFKHYKPDPETYLGAAKILGLAPNELMMVAAHPDDLAAAAKCGLRTGYVPRPTEYADDGTDANSLQFDLTAPDFVVLAERLGA
jgi:2-haloacid dehalogenase